MQHDDLLPRVIAELATIYGCPPSEIKPDSLIANFDKWDSMSHVKMMLELERVFGVRFGGLEAASFDRVDELVDLIQSKLAEGQAL